MIGSQLPRIRVEPERTKTYGEAAATLMEAYGLPLDPWQRMVVDCWLGMDDDGHYTVTSAGLAVPRQNGKNVCSEALEFFCMVILGEQLIHTAHQVVTAKKSFRRLERMFTDRRHPEIIRMIKQIRYTNGEEAIELVNGASIEFSARSRQRSRGFDGISRLIIDEAQEFTDDQADASVAVLSASGSGTRQIIYEGTPVYPGCPGTVFRRLRSSCMTDPSPHAAWHEWSVEANSAAEINIEDKTLWFMTNPALGVRLTEEYTLEESQTLTRDGFARERLGWWSPVYEQAQDLAIPAKAWQACRSELLKPEGKTAYGIKFTADGAEVVLCGAVIPDDGPGRISLIERRPTGHGVQWLADWLNQRYKKAACVVIDGRNGADVLTDKLRETWRAKGCVIRPSGRDVTAAASTLVESIGDNSVTWYKLQEDLSDSATGAIKRPIAGGWGFGGDNSGPIEAAALAWWGAKTSKRDPQRKMRIG